MERKLRILKEVKEACKQNYLHKEQYFRLFSCFLVSKVVSLQQNMSTKEKLIVRFMQLPKDFTFEETETLLGFFGYERHNKGTTSGSRIRFKNKKTGVYFDLHRPHPKNIMKAWMMKTIYNHLKQEHFI